jgi:hypothetical protein
VSQLNPSSPGRNWAFQRRVTRDLAFFTFLIWLGYVIIISAASLAINHWGTLESSVWDQARQLAQWFLLFLGVYVGSEILAQQITHGRTRREFFRDSSLFVFIISAFTTVLMLAGWLIERVLYRILDVEQSLQEASIISSATDYGNILLESFIVLVIWTAGGLFIASAWYRNSESGLLTIIPALLVAAIVDLGLGTRMGTVSSLLRRFFDPEQPPLAVTLGIAAFGIIAIGVMAWRVIRDIPIRNVAA